MSTVSPAGTRCIMRPWGPTQCDCKYDIHGNATCNLGDVSSQCYTKAMQNIKSEIPKQKCTKRKNILDELKAQAIERAKAIKKKYYKDQCERNNIAHSQLITSLSQSLRYSTMDNIWLSILAIVFKVEEDKKKYFIATPFHYP